MIERLSPDAQIQTARTAEEGIHLALEMRPDMLLLDIDLPGMDGYEALIILRSMDSLRHIPMIAVSAHAMPDNIQKGKDLGFNAYITKPVRIGELQDAIERYLPKKKGFSQTG